MSTVVSVMTMMIMTVAERKSDANHGSRSNVHRSRVNNRCRIHYGRRLDNYGLLHIRRLRINYGLDRLLDNGGLLHVLDDYRSWLLHHDWCRGHINGCCVYRSRFQSLRNDHSRAYSGKCRSGDGYSIMPMVPVVPVPPSGFGARSICSEKSQCCHCYQGLFHKHLSFVLLAWTESMLDYSASSSELRLRQSALDEP